jgi:hypothetical protein
MLTMEIKQYGGQRGTGAKTLLFMHSWNFSVQKKETDFPFLDNIFPFWILNGRSENKLIIGRFRRHAKSRQNLCGQKDAFFPTQGFRVEVESGQKRNPAKRERDAQGNNSPGSSSLLKIKGRGIQDGKEPDEQLDEKENDSVGLHHPGGLLHPFLRARSDPGSGEVPQQTH